MDDVLASHIGLSNLGNTCFLNVVLQALRVTPPLAVLFLKEKETPIREESKRREIVSAFQTLMRDFWRAEIPASACPSMVPRGFFHSLFNVLKETDADWYSPGQQADAAEALQYVLDSLHDGLYRRVRMDIVGKAKTDEEAAHIKCIEAWGSFFSKEYSPIVQNFNGQTQMTVKCLTCNSVSTRYEPWLMIKAPIPGADVVGGPAPTMARCLDYAHETETIDDYRCEKCAEKRTATIEHKISRLPPITIVSLKRFTNMGHKIRGKIGWDLDALNFAPWMAFHSDPFGDPHRKGAAEPVYETFAVIEHHGSTHGGHYRMYARQCNTWHLYDDSSVSVVGPDSVITADSYIALMAPKHHVKTMNAVFAKCVTDLRAAGKAAEA